MREERRMEAKRGQVSGKWTNRIIKQH